MAKKKKLKIKVQVIPSSGDTIEKTVTVSANGASVADILQAAGLDTKNKDITVGGKPAGLDTHVTERDVLEARTTVGVSERPQGS